MIISKRDFPQWCVDSYPDWISVGDFCALEDDDINNPGVGIMWQAFVRLCRCEKLGIVHYIDDLYVYRRPK